jgi:hypothetical protein
MKASHVGKPEGVSRASVTLLALVTLLVGAACSGQDGAGENSGRKERPSYAFGVGLVGSPQELPTEGPGICDPSHGPCSGTIVVTKPDELKAALEDAADNAIIQVPVNVTIDLDGYLPITIDSEGVTLYGGRHGDAPGALLHAELDHPVHEEPTTAFKIRANNVSILNVRLKGPSGGTDKSLPDINGINSDDQYQVTIAENEVYNWTSAAVRVTAGEDEEGAECDPGSEPSTRVSRTLVYNNYIHDNQQEGHGYGVGVYDGAFPFIIGNTFDRNRHSVSSDGHPQSGYYAEYNYVLSGGSRYGGFLTYRGSYEQHFDMHGDDNYGRNAFDPFDDDDGYGGHGGDLVVIRGNTVHGEQEYGGVAGIGSKTRSVYWLRGLPCHPSELIGNVFVHEEDEVVHAVGGGQGQYNSRDNLYDTDTSWSLGVGNFDHGRDDLFQATGAAWYYSSGGVAEWRLLQAGRTETIDRLRFGDFDGDGRTDVFTASLGRWLLSDGGTEPWEEINTSQVPLDNLRFEDFDGDGRTDVFTATGSRWLVSTGGTESWDEINTSQATIDELRFGNFDADRRADVFRIGSNQWYVSYDGVSTWQPLNSKLAADLESLVFADFNGNGLTDIAQSRESGATSIDWRVSWDGTGVWSPMRTTLKIPGDSHLHLYSHWIGEFDSSRGADAIRYEPPDPRLLRYSEGVYLVRLSSGRGEYVTHSWNPMR